MSAPAPVPVPPVYGLQGPATCLVTGAGSGIGQAALAQLLAHPQVAQVHAVVRRAPGADANADLLAALLQAHPGRLHLHLADLTDEAALQRLADAVAAATPALHLVLHCAGLLHAPGLQPERALAQVRLAALQQVFAIDAFAPILLARVLEPLLPRAQPAVYASLSARVGSIGDNRLGGWYAYRAAKAAQNQLLHTLAVEWRRTRPQATCLLLHPGTVDTPLSRPFQARLPPGQLTTPAQAAARLLAVIAAATPADSGRFLAWDGTPIPW